MTFSTRASSTTMRLNSRSACVWRSLCATGCTTFPDQRMLSAISDVLDAGYDLTEYRTVIFHQLFGHNPDIACGLNHSLTKKRFAMMTQFRKRRFAVLRLGAAIPVVAAMMMLCSFTVKTPLPAAGDPDRPTVTVHISSGGKILFNGRPVLSLIHI